MRHGSSVHTRLRRLAERLGPRCPGCAGRLPVEACLFRYQGVLVNGTGEPVDESVLSPCPVCGAGGVQKLIDGVNPERVLGIKVIEGVDPAYV